MRRRFSIVVLLAAAASGCRKDKVLPRIHQVEGESTILPRAGQLRGQAGSRPGIPHTTDVKGTTRGYLVLEPTSIDESKSYPLVLVFHGDGGESRGFHRAWPFERATENDAVVVYPEGRHASWDLETTTDNPDVLFVERVIGEVATSHKIDRARIFATGYSSGGFFANVFACQRPGVLRAIASNAGGAPYNQLEKWPNGYPKCPGQAATATLALHGARDFTVTLDSGRFTAEYWAYVNGCRTGEMETTGYAECHAYRGCPSGKAVAFCSIDSLGHWVWDEAAVASWTFFQRQ